MVRDMIGCMGLARSPLLHFGNFQNWQFRMEPATNVTFQGEIQSRRKRSRIHLGVFFFSTMVPVTCRARFQVSSPKFVGLVSLKVPQKLVPFYRGEGSPTKIDYRKNSWHPCSSLLTAPDQPQSRDGKLIWRDTMSNLSTPETMRRFWNSIAGNWFGWIFERSPPKSAFPFSLLELSPPELPLPKKCMER